jgi:regulatory protein
MTGAAPNVPNPHVAGDPEPDPMTVARTIVLRQLTLGPRSRAQLAEVLRRRGCSEQVAEAVLDRMSEVGLVDDAAFAQLLVDSRRRTKGLSGPALRRELVAKGVDAPTAETAVGSTDPQTERLRAEEVAARKLRSLAGMDPQVQARRLAGMLARRGYSSDVVYAVVRDLVNAAPEHQRD